MRLFQAAAASPLDIDVISTQDGEACALVYRCGWAHPSFRIKKGEGCWLGYDLDGGTQEPAFRTRQVGDMLALMSAATPARGRPTAS